jgi:acyl-CoA synthetase (AMP-forming)/AMP-acid ligase II
VTQVFSGKVEEAKTLPQLIRAAAAAYGDDIAVKLKGQTLPDDAISFAELERRSAELARGFIARGIGKGSRVGFILGNGPTFAVTFAALTRIGAIAIPLSTLLKSNELVRVLRHSDITGLIVQRTLLGHDYIQRLCEALPELTTGSSADLRIARLPYLRWIVSFGEPLPTTLHDISWLIDAAGSVSEELLAEAESEVHTTDQAIEIYTSGSMALPKGVKHLQGPIVFRAHWLRSMIGPERGKEYHAYLPMFWVGGLMMYLMPNWVAGATTTCTETTLSNSRVAMGSVLAEEDLDKIKGPKPWWGLGMSETLGPYSWGDDFRAPGYPVCAPMDHFADGYEVRIVDDHGNPVKDQDIGELQIRGYPVAPGLHKIERELYYTPDGFYRTGDMCKVDGKRVLFVGRNGDMIKTAGSNVSPAEVEMEMQQLEGIHSAYVVGLPDKERGQLLAAAVVPRDGVQLDFVEVEGQLRKRLSSYKVPRFYMQIAREQVPMLPSNKVARREIAAMLERELAKSRD